MLVYRKRGSPRDIGVVTHTRAWCSGMQDQSDMIVLHSLAGVDGRWCPSTVIAVLRLAYSSMFRFGTGGHAKR